MSDDTTTGSPALDLLAVIHGDGGHHTAAVGLPQSFEDAHAEVARLRGEVERLGNNERVAISFAGECKADLVRAEQSIARLNREFCGRVDAWADAQRVKEVATERAESAERARDEDAAELSRLRVEVRAGATVLASVVEALKDPARPEESPVDAARRLRSFFQRITNGGRYTRPRP